MPDEPPQSRRIRDDAEAGGLPTDAERHTRDREVTAGAPGSLQPGDEVSGRFVVEFLARCGGMGAVYRAHEKATGEPVAIKVMTRASAKHGRRFAREAAILSSLSHPGIVRYVSHGFTADGAPYFAMEWLEGEDLSERLRRGPLTLDESVSLLRGACDALEVAHRRHIVHRDIKPSNLFLVNGDAGDVRLLDFGVSRGAHVEGALTRDGDMIGTVGYMAPEQAMGQTDVAPSSDVFSLGAVLYECLTGCAPFAGAHAVAVLAKVLCEEPIAPTELRPGLPPAFNHLLSRALAKQSDVRIATAAALRVELDGVLARERFTEERPWTRMAAGAEQRIVSVILGKPAMQSGTGPVDGRLADTLSPDDCHRLARSFSVDIAPIQGGAVLLMLSSRGEANDRAGEAAACALSLHRLRPDLRLAVATGLAETAYRVPIGAAIDRAAELLSRGAQDGSVVLVDELTADLIGARFDLSRRAGCSVVVRLRVDLDAPRRLMGKPMPCVGRKLELRLLDSAFADCIGEPAARAVLVTGPPGIGKTRLASEWLDACAKRSDLHIMVARSDPMTCSSSLSLMQRLLRSAVGVSEAEPAAVQLVRLSEHLAPLLEAGTCPTVAEFLAELLGILPDEHPSPIMRTARSSPEIMREQVHRALDAWIAAESLRRPVIAVVEDLHWSDAPSISFLYDTLRQRTDRPLMLLLLARPEAEQRFAPLCQLASLHLRLPGLSPRDAERLLRAALDPAPGDEIVTDVVRTAAGNVFYLEELIRRVASGSSDLPETVLAMAQSRLEQLDPTARCVLRAASVFGEACWDEGVARIVDPRIDSARELHLLAERELLIRVPSARYGDTREYRFRHALLREAAYAMLTRSDREQAHCAAGEWLESIGEKEARLIAAHFVSGNTPSRALPWVVRATRSAIDHGDLKGTIELAQRGIELGAAGLDRGQLLLARAHAEIWSGCNDVDRLREALDLLPHGGAEWWLAVALLTLAESASGRPQEAATYASLALTAPPSSEQVGPAGQALLTLVGALVLLGRGELAGTLLERVEALPTSVEDPVFAAFLSSARCALAAVAPIGGRWQLEHAFRRGWEGVEQMRAIGAPCGEAMALNYFAVAATHLGRYEDAKHACLRALTLAQHVGSGLNRDWATVFLAKAQVRLDEPAEALERLATLQGSLDRNLQQMLPAITGEALFRQGRFEAAMREAEIAVAGPSPRLRRMAGYLRARALLALARPVEALSAVEHALTEHTTTGLESEIDLFAVRAEALLATGNVAAARSAIEAARAFVHALSDTITDMELRSSFLTNVEPCSRTLALARQLETNEPGGG